MIFWEKKIEKIIKIDEKRLLKRVALIKTDYEEGWLQPPPAGHPTLLSPGYFKEKISKKIIEIDEKRLRKKGGGGGVGVKC